MIRFAVIEDDAAMLNIVYQGIKRVADKSGQIDLVKYSCGEDFLTDLIKGEAFNSVFTDIQMKNLSGMELARAIVKIQPDIYIVFITSYLNYAAESYMINAYQYILKQDLEYRLPSVVNSLLNKITSENQRYLMIKIRDGKVKIYHKDIIYIYKSSKYVYFVTEATEYRERTTLQKVYEDLESKEFVWVERGFIVNMRHIYKISGDTLYLKSNQQVKISEARLCDVKRQINCYWGD